MFRAEKKSAQQVYEGTCRNRHEAKLIPRNSFSLAKKIDFFRTKNQQGPFIHALADFSIHGCQSRSPLHSSC